MTAAAVLEVFVSLVAQVTVLIAATALLARSGNRAGRCDRLWAGCHSWILCLTLLAVSLPHLRLLPWALVPAGTAVTGGNHGLYGAAVAMLIIWACGVVAGVASLLAGAWGVWRLLRTAQPVAADRLAVCWRSFSGGHKADDQHVGASSVRVLCSAWLKRPFCWQVHRPVIVLPETLLSFPPEQLALVLRHELEHVRAGHPLHLFLQRLVEILFWFHPCVWWASAWAEREREFHCDAVAASGGQTASYLRTLMRLAQQQAAPMLALPAGLAFGSARSLTQQRAERLAEQRDVAVSYRARSWRQAALAAAALGLAASLWIPVGASGVRRSWWSPCPRWSAAALHLVGIGVRDYEIDQYRQEGHHHHRRPAPAAS